MCCALALKNLVSVNFRLRREGESCGAEVEWCGSKRGVIGSKCGAIGSKCGAIGSKCGAIGSKYGAIGSKYGAIGSKRGARWSKGYVFLFDSKLESCLEASSFKYRITEILEEGVIT